MSSDSTNRPTNSDFSLVVGPVNVSLDTVTIDCLPTEDFFDYLEAEHELKLTRERPGRSYGATWRTADSGTFRFFELADGTSRIRYQIHPHGDELTAARGILKGYLRPTGYTRADVAIDYSLDLADEIFDVRRVHRETHTNSRGRVESMAFGKRSCPRYLRVYDKGLEARLDGPLWRVEAEYKTKSCRDLPADLFDGLTAFSWPPVPGLRWPDRAALHLAHDHPGIQRMFSSRTSARVDGLLSEYLQPLSPAPADAYRAALPHLQRGLDVLLGGEQAAIRAGPTHAAA